MREATGEAGPGDSQEASDLLARLISYLTARRGHSATSDQVLSAFDADAAKQQGALLKHTLKRVAVLQKQGGSSKWVLKDEFL